MFSGIIADVGTISSAQDREGGLRLSVGTQDLGMDDVGLGDSIAVNGVCLTVVKIDGKVFTVDVSRETLDCTVGLDRQGESWRLSVRAPQPVAKYIAVKGSITIDGVSLTVNHVAGAEFEVNLIPHTLAVTTLNQLCAGSKVNLEIDLIARYVERMMQAEKE